MDNKNISFKHKYTADFYRMTGIKDRNLVQNIFFFLKSHNLRFMYYYRKYQSSKRLIFRLILFFYSRKYGLEISPNANIDDGLYLGHPYNITVAEGVEIGKNVNIHKGVTIGLESRGKRNGVPRIGNNVYVGINSTIAGKVRIGNDVMIAPNTFINFDVPSHSVVIGNPAIIHSKSFATESYVNFCV
ncbi:serine O-acetyltransferase [Alloiococcus sp. CFN-8]|uniref:serine O-acetyltransferase n=1 Tax=Alloiococcus sp. CFN-8 TaxID=3416081 RepID=UPI003CFAA949